MRALVRTADGVYEVDLEDEVVLGPVDAEVEPRDARAPAAAGRRRGRDGSTVVAVVDRRPPLAISNDAGQTWREAGGGLPPGVAVAIADDDPDYVLYAARNRLYLSTERRRLLAVARARAARDRGGRARSVASPESQVTVCYLPGSTRSARATSSGRET